MPSTEPSITLELTVRPYVCAMPAQEPCYKSSWNGGTHVPCNMYIHRGALSMSRHSVIDRQHQASVGLLVLSHIGRRKRSVKLNKTPHDLQPVGPLELVAHTPCVIDTSSTHSHSWPPTTWFMQQVFGISGIREGE